MYFENFKSIYYPFTIGDKDVLKIVRDITTNVRIRTEVLSNITVYDQYDIQDGDTPDIIAAKYYGSSQYHWAIMLANEMYDYSVDFPMSNQVLDMYIQEKYNRFESSYWEYTFDTLLVVTIPNHGIVVSPGEVVTVENAFFDNDGTIATSPYLEGYLEVSGAGENTIGIVATGTLTGTPVGTLTLYTADRQYNVHHYEIDGFVVNADDEHSSIQREVTGAVEVTNYDYEVSVNDAKRRIKLITPDIVSQIAQELAQLV